MAAKIRVYELARELGLTNKETLDLCDALGVGVKSHSSSIVDTQADRIRRKADREGLRRRLEARGVETRVHYPTPVHRLAPFATGNADLPETDRAAAEVLSLPVGPHLSDGQVAAVAAAVAG